MADRNRATPMPVTGSLAIRIGSLFLLVLAGSCRTSSYADTEAVGQVGPQRYVTPVHQVLTPVGLQVELAGLRPQGLALSPDGRLLATSGKTAEVVLLDPQSGTIQQRVALPSDRPKDPNAAASKIVDPNKLGQLSYTGLLFSPDGSRLYLSNVNGDCQRIRRQCRGAGQRPVLHRLACRQCATPQAGDSGRPGAFPRWAPVVCGLEPVQSSGGDRPGGRQGAALVARGFRPLWRGPGRGQSLREQLGRAGSGRKQCHWAGRQGNEGAGGPGALHRQ